jgi:hypothetical protein
MSRGGEASLELKGGCRVRLFETVSSHGWLRPSPTGTYSRACFEKSYPTAAMHPVKKAQPSLGIFRTNG